MGIRPGKVFTERGEEMGGKNWSWMERKSRTGADDGERMIW